MKKLVLTIGCALAVSGAAFAQGFVNWSAITSTAVTAVTNAATYSSLSPLFGGGAATGATATGGTLGAGGFYLELLYSAYSGSQAAVPSTWAQLEAWSDAGAEGQSSAAAGKLTPISGSAGYTVPWSPGTTDSIVLVMWSANLGSTWAAAQASLNNWAADPILNAYLGVSQTGYITTLSTTPGSVVFATAATAQGLPIESLGTQLYALQVPEPATMALAGLGGLALLLIRRRS